MIYQGMNIVAFAINVIEARIMLHGIMSYQKMNARITKPDYMIRDILNGGRKFGLKMNTHANAVDIGKGGT